MGPTFSIERRSVHHQIAEHLRRSILAGELPSGAALPGERELAARFGVSRNSLRQAVAYLEAMGLVETRHGAGVFVVHRDEDVAVERAADLLLDPARSLVDIVEARLVLEPNTAALAAERRSPADLRDLEKFISMDGSTPEASPGNFHPRVARASGNAVLVRLNQALVAGPDYVLDLLNRFPDTAADWARAHRGIYDAISDADPTAAASLMTEHLRQVLHLAHLSADEGSSG